MPPTRKLTDVTSPVPLRVTYQLVVRPYDPDDPGQFEMVVPRRAGWNLALSWAAMLVIIIGLVALLAA
ncbi:MAG: hypothetical protein U0Q55_10095 [Vicinamibacterales bacterium]